MQIAIAAMLLSNRLLPAAMTQRAQAEIGVFCLAWATALLWAILRSRQHSAWRDIYAATALLLLAIPAINFLITDDSHLPASLARADWGIAAIDIVLLIAGLAFALMARRCHRNCLASMPGPSHES